MTERHPRSPMHRVSGMRVLRVLLVYLGASFGVLEAVDLLGAKLGLPDWVFAGALVLLLLGLPIVVATALIQPGTARAAEPSAADITSSASTPTSFRTLLTWRNALVGGVFAFALWGLIVTGWLMLASESEEAPEDIDPNLVAVLPFRVAGADASLAYLGEGMVDLMAALLTGEGGLRALDPRTTLAAAKRRGGSDELDEAEAVELARSLGAGHVMLGSVVGSRDALILAVSLNTVEGVQTVHTQAQGPADSLHALLDRLTGELLARRAGVLDERMLTLSPSLEAIRAYLDGRTDYRSGRFESAARHFARAVEIDSSFVLAASGATNALVWIEKISSPRFVRAAELAWDGRDRLPPRDRLLAMVLTSEADLVPISRAEMIQLLEDALAAFPDQPEAWYWLGDSYFHWGDRLGVEDPRARARADLERSFSLDSSFAVPLIHLVHLAAFDGDTSAAIGLLKRYVSFDPTSNTSAVLRLLVGTAVDDPNLVDDAFRIAAEGEDPMFNWAAGLALQFGVGIDQVERIHAVADRAVRTEADRAFSALQLGTSLAIRGRPNQAAEVLARAGDDADLLLILHALYSDLDDELVRDAVAREMQRAAAPPAETLAERRRQGRAACAVGQWKLWHGATLVENEIERLRAGSQTLDARGYPEADPTCLMLLEAMSAVNAGRQDARRLVERLDSLLLTGPPGQREEYNLAASYLLQEVSSPARALAAARRRSYDWDAPYFVATYLRQEGRLAAYSHYLKLRENPEPQLIAQRDSVQAALARLTGE